MSNGFFTKNPTRLACPRCGEQVDSGISLSSLILIAKNKLVCPHCAAPLRKESRYYFSGVVLILTIFSNMAGLASPWSWVVPLGGLIATVFLMGKEQLSTRLVVRKADGEER